MHSAGELASFLHRLMAAQPEEKSSIENSKAAEIGDPAEQDPSVH